MTIFVDISTSRHYSGKSAVGIVRVEREIAKHYFLNDNESQFMYFDHGNLCFRVVPRSEMTAILGLAAEKRISLQEKQQESSPGLGGQVEEIAVPAPVIFYRTAFRSDDVIISAGLTWDNDSIGCVFALKESIGLKFVQIVYDVIPTIMPEYCVPGMDVKFPKFLLDVSWTADLVFSISENTTNDFREFCDKQSLTAPPIERLFLGCDIHKSRSAQADDSLAQRYDVTPQGYVMYVSTIEPRKNHLLLFNIWRELAAADEDIPDLVFVGRRGWNTENLFSYVEQAPTLFPHRIKILHDLTDQQLCWMYENSLFTVYPSMYEGWGLPIVESLSFGTPCIVAENSSLLEAADGLCKAIRTFDYYAWYDEIEQMIKNDNYREEKKSKIAAAFSPLEWEWCAADFAQKLGAALLRVS